MVGFSKVALGVAEAFAPSPMALRSADAVASTQLAGRRAHGAAGLRCAAEGASRREFGRLIAGAVVAGGIGAIPMPAVAGEKVECRAKSNNGAEMGGTVCKGTLELDFQRAYVTTGTATKITGDAKKLATFYSQINAGLLTLQDLYDRWDDYVASGDGDVVRRRLGTVGNKSPLHNIRKVFEGAVKVALNSPIIEQEEFEELDELLNATIAGIAEVDTNLYSTAFVVTQETSGQLRDKGKVVLARTLDQYKKFVSILEPIYKAEGKS